MTQDYLNSKGNKDEGEVGQTFFDNLVARSFVQDLEKDSVSGKIIGCKMHDIVHDFVQSLTKNECLITDAEDVDSEIEALGQKVRHLTLTFRSEYGAPLSLSPSNAYYNCKNLRSLTTISLSYFGSSIAKIDSNFILQLKCLRTLDLSYNDISEVPKEICELIHLRHIDLSWNDGLKLLPDSICELYNLYTLRLRYCRSLEKLPDNMGKLINLKHLDRVVVCGEDEDRAALQVGDLRVLNLEGSLTIKLKGDLWDMKKLFHLEIDSKDVQYKQTISTVEILNGECKFLPPLGKFPYLEKLALYAMGKVEKIGRESLGIVDEDEMSLTSSSSTSFFPKWEVGVDGWNKEHSEISIIPCLSSLQISLCVYIKTLPDFLCKTPLQDLRFVDCPMLSVHCEQGSGEEWHKTSDIPNIKIS
ncbi:unnamed protein product [Malus baccata var. baccata]